MGAIDNNVQPAQKRVNNFKEVIKGLAKRAVFEEARRCPQCSDPVCMKGCPLDVDIPGFIRMLREGEVVPALEKIREENPLPAICGRVCSAPCELACILSREGTPIMVRALERFTAEHGRQLFSGRTKIVKNNDTIAIVGSGPAGLSAAAILARKGYEVTVLDALAAAGGVLRYGIPGFRLSGKVLDSQLEEIRSLGVVFKNSTLFGQSLTVNDLFEQGFSSILLAAGSGCPDLSAIPGTGFGRVYFAPEVLIALNLSYKAGSRQAAKVRLGEQIVIAGNGSAALDCARSCVRLGRKATIVFERTQEEFAVYSREKELAQEEGVLFADLTRVKEILADSKGFVSGVKCASMDYADPQKSGQWQLVAVPDSEMVIEADTVIMASENKINSAILTAAATLRKEKGTVWIDKKTMMTSLPGVFAAGDFSCGCGSVVAAVASGKQAARCMDNYLRDEGGGA